MGFFVLLKALRLRSFFILRQSFLVIFVSSFCLLSLGYGKSPPSLPLEDPSLQSLLPSDELILGPPSSAPAAPHSSTTTFEEFETTHSPLSHRAAQRKEAEILRLLKELKLCANVNEAKIINQRLQHLWLQSGSDTIDLLMSWAENAINAHNYGLALDYIDNALALFPTYAAAWVRRAWIHIQLSDFKLAMFDLNHAITLEPRNYITFFELGIIMEMTERPQLAIKAYEMGLHYYPQMQRLQKRIEILLEKQASQAL
ncbi:tetratricopeptide repeat protein [Bartonella sp. CB74]|uniref:tetratricopeptide repeat protein n=1 Tax=Bartonella sp. CB74 TaxID=3113620 RepID=UPI002F9697D4